MQELPPKKDVALVLLERSSVFVHLDPRDSDVIVPASFKREPRLVLQIGHNMQVPIPDLAIEDDGWSGTLSFRKVPFRCVVPWTSVFAIVGQDGRGFVWKDDVPAELSQPERPAEPPKVALAPAPPPDPPVSITSAGDADGKKNKGKAKRARKKGEKADKSEAPVLAAAPPPKPERPIKTLEAARAAQGPAAPAPAEAVASGEKSEKSDSDEVVSPTPGRVQPGKSNRPKRELPPYLRVIK